jgi:hypothetical protein
VKRHESTADAKNLYQRRDVHDPAQLSVLAIKELGALGRRKRSHYLECRLLALRDKLRRRVSLVVNGTKRTSTSRQSPPSPSKVTLSGQFRRSQFALTSSCDPMQRGGTGPFLGAVASLKFAAA